MPEIRRLFCVCGFSRGIYIIEHAAGNKQLVFTYFPAEEGIFAGITKICRVIRTPSMGSGEITLKSFSFFVFLYDLYLNYSKGYVKLFMYAHIPRTLTAARVPLEEESCPNIRFWTGSRALPT